MQDALILLCVLGGALALWQWSVTGRERVLAISAEICQDLQMQRLDDSVTLRRLRPVFEDGLKIERGYVFEFSTNGADRRRGEIMLRGNTLQWARVEHPDGPVFIDTRGIVSARH
jgi:hypothetical protein